MRHTRVIRSAAALSALLLGVAACSSDDEKPTSAGSSSAAATKPTGEPIELIWIGSIGGVPPATFPEALAGAKAAVQAINDSGGINNRPFALTVCDTKNDPAQESVCAQNAVSSKAVAVVDEFAFASTSVVDSTLQAGMANVGMSGIGTSDLAEPSTNSFPLGVSSVGLFGCPASFGARGLNSVGALTVDNASAKQLTAGMQAVLANVPGTTFAGASLVNQTSADLAGPVQTSLDQGAQGVMTALAEDQLISALRAANGRFTACTSEGVMSVQNLTDLGAAADGFTAIAATTPVPVLEANKGDNGAAGEQFLADMDAYFQSSGDEAAAPERRKGTTVNGWMSVRAVEQVAKKLPEVTRDSVLKGFSSTTDMSFPGLLFTTIDFTKPQPVPTLARLFDSVYKAYVWDASKKSFSTDDKPLDIIKLLTGQK